jgi:hypothetical protein
VLLPGGQHRSLRLFALHHITPERDQKLPRERDDADPPDPPPFLAGTFPEPPGQHASRLRAHSKPGEFNHNVTQAPVTSFGDTLLAINGTAPPWR